MLLGLALILLAFLMAFSQNSASLPSFSAPNFITNASGNYVAKNSIFEAIFPGQSREPITITKDKSLSFTLANAQATQAKVDGNKILYANAYSSSNIVYQTINNGIKESIILLSNTNIPDEFSYNFNAQDLKAELANDNSIEFTQISNEPAKDIPVSDGTVIKANQAVNYLPEHPVRFKIAPPIMIDAKGQKSQVSDVKVILGKNSLTLIPNKDWLKKATFPVTLDPTVETTPQIVKELANKRTETSKEFLNDDGSYTSVIYQNPIQYKDGNTYKDIDRTFRLSDDPSYKYQVKTGIYIARLKKTLSGQSDIELDFGGSSLGLSPLSIGWDNGDNLGTVKAVEGKISGDGSSVTYSSLFGIQGVDLQATYDNEKFLKETVINDPQAIQAQNHTNDNLEINFALTIPSDVDLRVNGKTWDKTSTVETQDTIGVFKNGVEISDLRKAIVYGASKDPTNLNNIQIITIRLAKVGNQLILTKIISGNWLSNAIYPVRTDTTDTIYADTTDGEVDSYSASGSFENARNGIGDATFFGSSTVTTATIGQFWEVTISNVYDVYQYFVQFNTSGIGTDTISSATFSLYGDGANTARDWTIEVRVDDWGPSLDIGMPDFVAGTSLGGLTLVAHWDPYTSGWPTNAYTDFTDDAMAANINKNGQTRLMLDSSRVRLDQPYVYPSGETADFYTADQAGTSQDPKLTIVHSSSNPIPPSSPSSSTYTLIDYGFGSGGTANSSDGTYQLYAISGEIESASPSSLNYGLLPGLTYTLQPNTPPAPIITNPASYYNKLSISINNANNPSDTTFAIQIASGSADFSQNVYYVQSGSDTLGTAIDWETYATWNSGSAFTLVGLLPNTTYYARVAANRGLFQQGPFGPPASAATVNPSFTFNLQTSSQTVPPFTVSMGTMTPGGGIITAPDSVTTTITTNANSGGLIYLYGQNAGLKSTSASNYTISTVPGKTDLGTLTEGYGAQGTSVGGTGGPMELDSPYNGTTTTVGVIDTNERLFADSSNAPVSAGTATFALMARAKSTTPPAGDYTDIITVIATGSF